MKVFGFGFIRSVDGEVGRDELLLDLALLVEVLDRPLELFLSKN
jgi:hypothetical protein